MSDRIEIQRLHVECVIGIYPHERECLQPLIVDLTLELDLEGAGANEAIAQTVDYAALSHQVRFILEHGHFRMLETAAVALLRYLLAPPARGEARAQILAAEIRLEKPEALRGAALPAVQMQRSADWVALEREYKPFGEVDVIHETQDVGIYRLCLAPGKEIPMHVHHQMREAELALTSGLQCQGEAVTLGSYRVWGFDVAHEYRNETGDWQSILCIDSPPFIEEDERLVDRPADPVVARTYWENLA